jgi:hypothetical protein
MPTTFLHRAGWPLGIYSLAGPQGVVYVVEGMKGENLIRGEGAALDAACSSACDQARAVGMYQPRARPTGAGR